MAVFHNAVGFAKLRRRICGLASRSECPPVMQQSVGYAGKAVDGLARGRLACGTAEETGASQAMPGLEEATGAARRETGERATPRPQEETAALPTYSSSSSAPHERTPTCGEQRKRPLSRPAQLTTDRLNQNLA